MPIQVILHSKVYEAHRRIPNCDTASFGLNFMPPAWNGVGNRVDVAQKTSCCDETASLKTSDALYAVLAANAYSSDTMIKGTDPAESTIEFAAAILVATVDSGLYPAVVFDSKL
jgi:hypothetical protein